MEKNKKKLIRTIDYNDNLFVLNDDKKINYTEHNRQNNNIVGVTVRVLAENMSANGTIFTPESIRSAYSSLLKSPIVAESITQYDGNVEIGSHGGKLEVTDRGLEYKDTTVIIGAVDSDFEPTTERVMNDDGRTYSIYYTVKGYLWKNRNQEIVNYILNNNAHQSMEVSIYDYEENDNGELIVHGFDFLALCALNNSKDSNKEVKPAFGKANIVVDSSKENFEKKYYEELTQKSFELLTEIKNVLKYNQEEVQNLDNENKDENIETEVTEVVENEVVEVENVEQQENETEKEEENQEEFSTNDTQGTLYIFNSNLLKEGKNPFMSVDYQNYNNVDMSKAQNFENEFTSFLKNTFNLSNTDNTNKTEMSTNGDEIKLLNERIEKLEKENAEFKLNEKMNFINSLKEEYEIVENDEFKLDIEMLCSLDNDEIKEKMEATAFRLKKVEFSLKTEQKTNPMVGNFNLDDNKNNSLSKFANKKW